MNSTISYFPTLSYDDSRDANENGTTLARLMGQQRREHHLSGFFFDFGANETATFKRAGKSADNAAWDMMRLARSNRQKVEIYKNRNGQIAARLATP